MPRTSRLIVLGLLQGPAELLPVSSSAHVGLLLGRMGLAGAARKEAEVALHAGSALALATRARPRWGLLAAATAPPALAGWAFERAIEERLGGPRSVAAGLVLGGVAMVIVDRAPARRSADEATVADGAWLGAAQALALIPGVSRSGATRAVARWRGFGRAPAAELSREVALPVLVGAAVLKRPRLADPALAAAALSTWAAMRAERLDEVPLWVWAAYRVAVAVVVVCHDRAR